ncbi:MAG: hypothetical protein HQM00_03485 [Magnetococcales bacterium]|nr:hypothetical protein [Magnetococcales bacterium]
MSHATVQGLLKNTDLLQDAAEIRSVVESAHRGRRPLELHAGKGQAIRQAMLTEIRAGEWLLLNLPEEEPDNRTFAPGQRLAIYFYMGGYSLESKLECLALLGTRQLRVGFPALFRVHSKRQVSRFTVPMNMTCLVEMTRDSQVIRGELQDLNLDGLSFLGEASASGIGVEEAVRVRLIPSSAGDAPLEMTGVLRFAGQERHHAGGIPRFRYSVQLVGMMDPEAFRLYFGKISSTSHGWFRASVISAESYRLTTAI